MRNSFVGWASLGDALWYWPTERLWWGIASLYNAVIPAKAGIQERSDGVDSRFRGNEKLYYLYE